MQTIQLGLNTRAPDLEADCYFGRGTEAAVKEYQREQEFAVTGVVDSALRVALADLAVPDSEPEPCEPLSTDDG